MSVSKVLAEFESFSLHSDDRVTEAEAQDVLNKICKKNCDLTEFDSTILQQIFEEIGPGRDKKVTIGDLANTIIKAQRILKENIQQIKTANIGNEDKHEDNENYEQFCYDHYQVTAPFQNCQKPVHLEGMTHNTTSGIFNTTPSPKQTSKSLKAAVILSVICLLFQIIFSFEKHHFFNQLIYIGIITIVMIGFFDCFYIRFLLVALAIGTILDLTWLIVMADHFWSPIAETQRSTMQTGFLRFIYVFTVFLMLVKPILILLLVQFRNNDSKIRKSIQFFGSTTNIDGAFNPRFNRLSYCLAPEESVSA